MASYWVLWVPRAAGGNQRLSTLLVIIQQEQEGVLKSPRVGRGHGSTRNTAADNQSKADFTHYGLAFMIESL